MKRITPLLAALLLSVGAGMAAAKDVTDAVIAELQAQGYTHIEIRRSATQLKVQAVKDGVKIERTIDRETGDVLKSESSADGGAAQSGNDDGANDDVGDDNGSDDSAGSDDGPDHDAGDDNGDDSNDSADDNGGDQGAGDDNSGSDDNESEDESNDN